MSERSGLESRGTPPVLVIDPTDSLGGTARTLQDALGTGAVRRVTDLQTALEFLEVAQAGCLVYPFDFPPADLERVRERADCPLLAVAGGANAEAALEAGATDVLDPDAPRAEARARVETILKASSSSAAGRTWTALERAVLENGPATALAVDSTGTVESALPSVEAVLGYTPSELVGRPVEDVVQDDDRRSIRRALEAARNSWADEGRGETGDEGRGETGDALDGPRTVQLRHADGTRRTHVVTVRGGDPAPDDGLVLTVGPAPEPDWTDVEAWVGALERPAFAVDEAWRIVATSDEASVLFGDDPTARTSIQEALPADRREVILGHLREARESGSAVRFRTPLSPDGEGAPEEEGSTLEWVGAPTESGVLAIAVGASTDRDEASPDDEAGPAVETTRALEAVTAALRIGVVVFDRETERTLEANSVARELLGDDVPLAGTLDSLVDQRTRDRIRRRASDSTVRRADTFEATVRTEDGDRTVSATVVSLSRDRAALCVLGDRPPSADDTIVSTLSWTSRALRSASSPSVVSQHLADGILGLTPSSAACCYLLDGERLYPAAVAPTDADPTVHFPTLDCADVPALDPRRLSGPSLGYLESRAFDPLLATGAVATDQVFVAPVGDHGVVVATGLGLRTLDSTDVEATDWMTALAATELETMDRRRALEALEETVDRLEADRDRLGELETVVQGLESTLADASDRRATESVLCTDLAGLEWIDGAWFGDVDPAAETVTERASAGSAVSTPPVAGSDGFAEDGDSLSAAIESDSVSHVPAADRKTPGTVGRTDRRGRFDGPEDGAIDVVSLPLSFDDRRYGVLTLSVSAATVTSNLLERLETLRTHLSLAFAVGEYRRFLTAEDRLELTFTLPSADDGTDQSLSASEDRPERLSPGDPLVALATRCRCRVDLLALSEGPSGTSVVCSISDDDLEASTVRSIADGIEGLEALDVSSERDARLHVEVRLAGETLAGLVGAHGGTLRTIDGRERRPTFVVDLAPGTSVRSFVDRLERWEPDVELRSKRVVSSGDRPSGSFEDRVRDQLTERQLETLRFAYYSGYFESPREHTGGEVADLLDVSQPTFTRHLRIAERKVYELLFEAGEFEQSPD
ncbi:bacterio-opsin activator domain-containing protein [Natronosalvus halobius]|uniref:bacterio-opsin activator domain-containing protein n=1 Tax=Natronosalvus halobius TaxID=2953746 RepID=UPI0020A20EFC|nr:bacterio-opsin activator domain-containing protein [Natronosalvus halobius]USZ71922.1 helix-turn-helix domain-containing protein [Natronosalvus halobius]